MAKLDMFSLSHVGLVRTNNEDYTYVSAREGIAVLADGMGGHKAGEVASEMAVEVAAEELRYTLQFESSDLMQCLMQVGQAMELANQHVYNLSIKKPEPTADHPALEALENLQPDNISPRQALDELYRLKKMMKKD